MGGEITALVEYEECIPNFSWNTRTDQTTWEEDIKVDLKYCVKLLSGFILLSIGSSGRLM
jgi:hypothetical protein